MKGKVDLHIHTNHSDGFYSPEDVVLKAKENDLEAISITDHDNLSGINDAIKKGNEIGIEVIPGLGDQLRY